MKRLAIVLLSALFPAAVFAQPRTDAALRVTVVDPSGAVIVGARVTVTPTVLVQGGPDAAALDTGARGDAAFASIEPGRYTIRVESPGFEPATIRDIRLRAGDNRREVKLAIAKFAETVDVGRDPRDRGADPRSDAFATVLGPAEINELPDDPDEMERVLQDMAGPGAVMRVNGPRRQAPVEGSDCADPFSSQPVRRRRATRPVSSPWTSSQAGSRGLARVDQRRPPRFRC